MKTYFCAALLAVTCLFTTSTAFAQQPTTTWRFAGTNSGTTTHVQRPDGTFESVTEAVIAGVPIKSRLTGRFSGDALVEYELVTDVRGEEVRTSAREGKVRIATRDRTIENDYRPSSLLFTNYHPVLSQTILKGLDHNSDAIQTIDVFSLASARAMKIDVSKKKTRTYVSHGRKGVANVYLLRFGSGLEMDLYTGEDLRFAGWEVPAQKLQVVLSDLENLLVDPTTLDPALSQPVSKTRNQTTRIKMRDGVELAADLFIPEGGGRYPTILVRTPYGRERMSTAEGDWWATRGYVYIAQDVRGRNDSAGEWNPFANERKDGFDTIEWIANQPWSDGKVGMIGGSYLGWVQWAAAVEAHPALKCIVPQVSPPDPFFNFPYDHGIPMLYSALIWLDFVKEKKTPPLPSVIKDVEKLSALPLPRVDDETIGRNIPFYDRWLQNETPSSFGSANFMPRMNRIHIPILHISGWWDTDGIGTKLNWERMRSLKHKDQWLIYGPWTHLFNTSSRVGDVDYGPDAVLDLDSIYLRWFDQWLKGKAVNWLDQPKVRVFVTGANEWRALDDWPDSRSKETRLYLSSTSPANGGGSKGELIEQPPRDQEPDRYTYNPAGVEVPKELTKISDVRTTLSTAVEIQEGDQDVLVYKTAPLSRQLEIGGPIVLDLHFSTSAKDTDFFAYLVDVDETGAMRMIGKSGKIRARYLNGWNRPALLESGKVYRASISLWDTAHQFKKGHRLGLVIQSQMFPGFARNLNTGEPIATATRMVAAHQTIYHDTRRRSVLRFHELPEVRVERASLR